MKHLRRPSTISKRQHRRYQFVGLDLTASPTTLPSTSSSSPSATPSSPFPGSAVQAAYAVDPIIGTATIPTSRMELQGARQRSLGLSSLPQRSFLRSSSLQRHRFVARQRRAPTRHFATSKHVRRETLATVGCTPQQSVTAKGYADGWKAAKTFAAYNSSRLGKYSSISSVSPRSSLRQASQDNSLPMLWDVVWSAVTSSTPGLGSINPLRYHLGSWLISIALSERLGGWRGAGDQIDSDAGARTAVIVVVASCEEASENERKCNWYQPF